MKKDELKFSYRNSFFKENKNYIVISCKIKLTKKNKEEILEKINTRRQRRLETQPLEYPSAGSVFRNPDGMHAGALIEECNLKGYSIGGAMISKKHANFIINYNNATGKDIIELIEIAQREVLKKYNIKLVLEQIIID
jgi:UDP-N-acetylmuramate dehydrogenase